VKIDECTLEIFMAKKLLDDKEVNALL